jgi:ribosome-binding protein aMBF1 (putative translation factor)
MDPEDSDPLDPEEILEKLLRPEVGHPELAAALKRLQQLPKDLGLQDVLPKTRSQSPRPRLESPPAATIPPEPAGRRSRRPRGLTIASAVERVREFLDRQDDSWSQEKLAERAIVSVESIGRLLAGQPVDRKTWRKVARAMGITYEELLS